MSDVRAAAVRDLSPAYFAMVMATGIVSIDMRAMRLPVLSAALLWVGAAGYAVLLVLYAWRLLACRAEMVRDLRDPGRAFGFFTFTAGTNVLGTRLAMEGRTGTAAVLLAVGAASWVLFSYLVPWAALLSRDGTKAIAGANGTWFVWVVGGQSVAVLAATLEPAASGWRDELALLAVMTWSISIWLYLAVAIVVAFRLMLFEMGPRDLTPPYWVAMGATAISVVAGAQISNMRGASAAAVAHDLSVHVSLLFWSFGSWIFVGLIIAGWWRHIWSGVPLRYGPGLWSMVFPLGMYGAASHNLGTVAGLPILVTIGDIEVWFGLLAWLLTFGAMAVHLAGGFRALGRPPDQDGRTPG
ncbi:tellurite resistance/C4-dicarboxylate transporter family protein [Microtetraspora sp. AC03309]|nr:tellurite resistance/C4-dicarboxylate transporter family protein [Microtetraspora sp. AC03309]